MNPGYDPVEISKLREECNLNEKNFVYIEDEEDEFEDMDEHAHVQFIGEYKGSEVIYDALIYTLRFHHSVTVYELALERLQKVMPGYVPPDFREEDDEDIDEMDEEAEFLLSELIDEIEDNEEIKVQEHLEEELDFDFGIGLSVGLNVEAIDDKVISDFINRFNTGNLDLDRSVYSFKSEETEDEDE